MRAGAPAGEPRRPRRRTRACMHDRHPLRPDQPPRAAPRCARWSAGPGWSAAASMWRPPARCTAGTSRPPALATSAGPAGADDRLGDLDRAALHAAGDQRRQHLQHGDIARVSHPWLDLHGSSDRWSITHANATIRRERAPQDRQHHAERRPCREGLGAGYQYLADRRSRGHPGLRGGREAQRYAKRSARPRGWWTNTWRIHGMPFRRLGESKPFRRTIADRCSMTCLPIQTRARGERLSVRGCAPGRLSPRAKPD